MTFTMCFQVDIFGLTPQFTRVVKQVLNIGISFLRQNLNILVTPIRDMLDGLVKDLAPQDLSALL